MIEKLAKFWNNDFTDFVPEVHNLKHEYKDRWVRFHSLPESKRYPENEAEYLEVLSRHNVVLQELCGSECNVFVVLPEYSENRLPAGPEPELSSLFSGSEPWCTLQQHEDGDDCEYYWHLHGLEVKFTGGEFNSLFRMVANDEVGNIMIICPSKGFVFHPYDGGADVVLKSEEERDRLKALYHEWLSSHPDGF
jgi:hypothetical protein